MDQITQARIVPVVVVDNEEQGLNVADAISAGGLPIAEVTLRTPGAMDAIRGIAAKRPNVLVAAGPVINADQVDEAVDAGAKFIVSPGLHEPVVRRAQERGVPVLPGVASASDVMRAVDMGLDTVKLFPANVVGGPAAIKALSAPFPQVKFMPTGGVNKDNLDDYLGLPSVVAAGGSWMVDRNLINDGDWDEISRRTAEAVNLASPSS